MDANDLVNQAKQHALRVAKSDFQRIGATDPEREELEKANVRAKPAQDYAAWRRSVLYCAAALLIVTCGFQWSGYRSFEDQMVDQVKAAQAAAVRQRQPQGNYWNPQAAPAEPDEAMIRKQTRQTFGVDNLETLDTVQIALLVAVAITTLLALSAASKWTDVQKSRKHLRIGALVLVGAPLIIALVPWMRVLDFSHLEEAQRKQLESLMGLGLGFSMFMMVAPKIIGLFPGILRASMTLKTMLHESPTPGYLAVMSAPIFVVLLLMMFTTINQMQGSIQLLVGLGALTAGAGIYVMRAKDLLRSHTREEAITVVADIRKTAFLFTVVGVALIGFWIFNLELLEPLQAAEFLATAGGGLLLMMVAGADFIVNVVEREYHMSKTFQASGGTKDFEEKIAGLQDAGFITAPVTPTETFE